MIDPRGARVMVDANALDRDGTRDALVDRFLALVAAGAIRMVVADGVRDEATHPHTPPPVRAALLAAPLPARPAPTHQQKLDRIRLRAILRGDARPGRHAADAAHLAEAAETGCDYVVTHDKRILRKRADLWLVLPPTLAVVTLAGFMALYDEAAAAR